MFAYSTCPNGGCGDGGDLLIAFAVVAVLLLAYLTVLAVIQARLTDRDAARRRANRHHTED